MAKERVPLYPEEEEHDDEPFVTSADELKEGIDRSDYDDEKKEEPGSRTEEVYSDAERRGVQRLVQKLKEKGKSEEFIEEHMDEIRSRVRDELGISQERR